MSGKKYYVPITPAGTECYWLKSDTEEKAKENLLKDAAHMPYDGWEGFYERGYRIEYMEVPY